MKKVEGISDYIIVKADNNSEWDFCEYAIIKISQAWKERTQARLGFLEQFKTDNAFLHIAFLEQPAGFFKKADEDDEFYTDIDEIVGQYEDWAFIIIDEYELNNLAKPESKLNAHQVIISWDSTIRYKAYGKHTGEEFYTHEIDVSEIFAALNKNLQII